MAAAAAAIALACLLCGEGALARHRLNRGLLAAGQTAWQITGPQWTRPKFRHTCPSAGTASRSWTHPSSSPA